MTYEILIAESSKELTEKVNEALARGGSLVGGVAVATHYESWRNERKGYNESRTCETFAQAITFPSLPFPNNPA